MDAASDCAAGGGAEADMRGRDLRRCDFIFESWETEAIRSVPLDAESDGQGYVKVCVSHSLGWKEHHAMARDVASSKY